MFRDLDTKRGGKVQTPRPQKCIHSDKAEVFAIFDITIQKFKMALTLIDQNRNGGSDKKILAGCTSSLGTHRTNADLDAVMDEAPRIAPWFSVFRVNGTDRRDVIRSASACFDKESRDTIQEDYWRATESHDDRFPDRRWCLISLTSHTFVEIEMTGELKIPDRCSLLPLGAAKFAESSS